MLRLVAIAISGAAVLVLITAWASALIPHQIDYCEQTVTGEQHCASYNTALFVFWQIAKFVDDHNGSFSAVFAGMVAVFTWRLYVSTDNLFVVTKESADAAEKSAVAAVAAQRPWISVTTELNGPLIVDENEVRIDFCVTLLNHGNTPSVSTRTFVRMAATGSEGQVDLETAIERCLEISRRAQRGHIEMGITIFPKNSETGRYQVSIPRSEMLENAHSPADGEGRAILIVAACVDYEFGKERGQTAVSYILTPLGGTDFGFSTAIGVWPRERLSLQRMPFKVYAI